MHCILYVVAGFPISIFTAEIVELNGPLAKANMILIQYLRNRERFIQLNKSHYKGSTLCYIFILWIILISISVRKVYVKICPIMLNFPHTVCYKLFIFSVFTKKFVNRFNNMLI